MQNFVDTHCHLQLICQKNGGKDFLPNILSACKSAGVSKLLTLSASLDELPGVLEIVEEFEFIYGALGVHPHDAEKMAESHFEFIKKNLQHPKISALGEIGLDYYYEYSPKQIQRKVFERFLEVANDLAKPVVIHTRDAEEDTKSILKNYGNNLKGVVHCFTGSVDLADYIMNNCPQLCLGFTGVITFKNAEQIRNVIREVPLERIFIETDSPFMAPEPHRGKINDPSLIPYVAKKIAEIKNITLEKVLEITNSNCNYLFQGQLNYAV